MFEGELLAVFYVPFFHDIFSQSCFRSKYFIKIARLLLTILSINELDCNKPGVVGSEAMTRHY